MTDYDDRLEDALSATDEATDATDRLSLPEPTVRHEGDTTSYENFGETVARLNRDESHVLRFLKQRLGTRAEIDDQGRARLAGRFDSNHIGELVEEYTDTFVRCPECRSPDTHLEREEGALVLRCEACGARTVVPDQD